MQPAGLHWFRRQQRTLSRLVLAAFCLTWLQLAAMPCVMALDAEAGMATQSSVATAVPVATMSNGPDGMAMAPGEHCQYCPPPMSQSTQAIDAAGCSFPHDPQVDLRAGFAATLLAPPPTVVLFVVADAALSTTDFVPALTPAPPPRTSLAVSLCRFLK